MEINAVSTNTTATPSFNPQHQPLNQSQGTQTQTVQAVQEPQAADRARAEETQAARATINAQGQKVGTRVNEMA